MEFHTAGNTGACIPLKFTVATQSPHSRHTVATQSPLQSPLQNTIVATEFSKKKGQVSFANQKLVATTVFSSGDCSGDCVATVWRLCSDCTRPRFSNPPAGLAWRARRVPSDHTLHVSQGGLRRCRSPRGAALHRHECLSPCASRKSYLNFGPL